jgi:hypothetical protein
MFERVPSEDFVLHHPQHVLVHATPKGLAHTPELHHLANPCPLQTGLRYGVRNVVGQHRWWSR